jgi:hypothetical protein
MAADNTTPPLTTEQQAELAGKLAPTKSASLTPLATAIVGGVTGVVCLLMPSVASAIGTPLLEGTRQTLELGGAGLLVGGLIGARFMPVKA